MEVTVLNYRAYDYSDIDIKDDGIIGVYANDEELKNAKDRFLSNFFIGEYIQKENDIYKGKSQGYTEEVIDDWILYFYEDVFVVNE